MKIAIYNLKGGVGKTVTTANLAHLYATQRTHHVPGSHRGQAPQVLMIDCDPQGNLTQFYKRYDQSAPCGMREKEVIGTDWPFLSLMPGNMDLYELERSYYESKTVDALADIGSGYDIVLIDCPPALNMLTINALSIADYIVIPVRLDAFSSQGLVELDTQLQDVLQINPALQLLGVLITHDERTTLSDEAEDIEEVPEEADQEETPTKDEPITWEEYMELRKEYKKVMRNIMDKHRLIDDYVELEKNGTYTQIQMIHNMQWATSAMYKQLDYLLELADKMKVVRGHAEK